MICKRLLLSSPTLELRLCGDAAPSCLRSRYSLAGGLLDAVLGRRPGAHAVLTGSIPLDLMCSFSFTLKVLALTAVRKRQGDASKAPLARLYDHHVLPNI